MKVLATAKDAGGANAIVPVLTRLLHVGAEVRAVAYEQSSGIFLRNGLPAKPVEDYGFPNGFPSSDLPQLAGRIISTEDPDVILVGTSWGYSLDKELVAEGNRRGLPTVAVLDMWSYYRERCSRPTEAELSCLPSRLAVMDELAREEAVAAGIPEDRIAITGQPYLDRLHQEGVSETAQREGDRLRAEWGRGRPVVLFVSEVIGQDFPLGSPWYRGYTELDALAALAKAMPLVTTALSLAIKLHPQQESGPFHLDRSTAALAPTVVRDVDSHSCVAAADVLVGMTSTLLIEAAMAGKPALSFQPNLIGPDHFIGNRRGWTRGVYEADGLAAALREALERSWKSPTHPISPWCDGRSTERVMRLLQNQMEVSAR